MSPNFPSIISRQHLEVLRELGYSAPSGDFVEVGVYKGGSAEVLYEVALLQNRTLHLFDTFTGTPFYTEGLDKHRIDREFAAEEAPGHIHAFMPKACIYPGIYPTTHPESLKDIAFIHVDCDQYLSYKAVIANLWPLVVFGGMMLFDDYPYLQGAKKAVEEHFTPDVLLIKGQRVYVRKC